MIRAVTKGAFAIGREVLRMVFRRPVLGAVTIALDDAGRILLMRRAGSGQWCLPGGSVDWGEDLRAALAREILEETGYRMVSAGRIVGVYSDPDRDPRMHAVCVLVETRVAPPDGSAALNPLESLEARPFAEADLPRDLAFDCGRMLDDWRAKAPAVLR